MCIESSFFIDFSLHTYIYLLKYRIIFNVFEVNQLTDYMVDLLMRLVAIDTNSYERKNYDVIVDLVGKEANQIGCIVERVVDNKGVPHLIINLPNAPKKAKKIVFLAHYDVVPPGDGWEFDPFKPFVKDGKVFGRGASDDKSGIAAGLTAFKEIIEEGLKPSNNPVLIVSGGEETGESVEFYRSIMADIGVVLDTGPEGLSIGASGVARVKVIVKGKQAHSAYPFKGRNAIYLASKLLSFLEDFGKRLELEVRSSYRASSYYDRLPARLSVTMIKGGVAANIIPDKCELLIDRRTIPEEKAEDAARTLEKKIYEFARTNNIEVDVEARGLLDAWVTKDERVINKFREILREVTGKNPDIVVELGGTDGCHLIERMPVIQFGALRDDNNIHGKNEFVYIDDLILVKNFIKKVVTTSF